jgi:neural cell adhesion molecule
LPCKTSHWAEDGISLVIWYHGNSGIPIYTLDARSSPLSQSKHMPSDEFGGRAYFDTAQDPPALKIEPINEDDEGIYRCRVDYRKSRTQSFTVNLNITGNHYYI